MLSGEGNAGERWKTTRGLISKNTTLHMQHTYFEYFLCCCFAWLQCKISRNFFYGGNVVRVLVHFFFTASHFLLALVAASISHFVTACRYIINFMLFFQQKCLLCFLSRALDLCRPFSRWVSLACRLLSPFLCLSLALYSKLVDMRINLSLIL